MGYTTGFGIFLETKPQCISGYHAQMGSADFALFGIAKADWGRY